MKRPILLVVAILSANAVFAKPVRTERVTGTLAFNYEWPAKAQAIPGLHAYLRADMEKAFRQASADAAEDARQAHANHFPFRQHSYSVSWDSEGESARLISLEVDLQFDTNGAHPNSATHALLWDLKSDKQVTVASLFTSPNAFPALTRSSFCKALDAERLRRRDGERLEGEFAQCPAFKELAIILVDRKRNHRFDHLLFVASPYVAGPYVEGSYEISLPISSSLIAAMKPDYRSSFAVQRQ